MSDLCVVLCTCPDKSHARNIACKAVEENLAACVNIIPGILSVYRWQGKVLQNSECQLVLKTHKEALAALQKLVFKAHPYDVPEWIVLDVDDAGEEYEQWIKSTVK